MVNDRRLDYELLDRWIKYMAKPTDKYHNKDEWQALMKKGGGTQQEAKKLADKFQQEIIDVTVAKDAMDEENRVITDKDVDGTKPKKRTDKPSNFVSNKDFNPGALLRLKSLPDDQTNFWTEIFLRELKDNEDPNDMVEMDPRKMTPGVLMFRGWGLESRLGPESQARLKSLQDDLEALKKKIDPYYPFIHGVKDSEKPVNIQLALRGNPENAGARSPPSLPEHFLGRRSHAARPGQRAHATGGTDCQTAHRDARHRQPNLEGGFWHRIVDTPSNFGFGGERPTDPELLEYLANEFVKNGMSIKKLQREIMLSAVYQLSTAETTGGCEGFRRTASIGAPAASAWMPNRSGTPSCRYAGDLDDLIGGPSKDLTPRLSSGAPYMAT